MSASDRCALRYETLLELTSTEQHRWHDWFVERPQAWAVPFATGRMATIGGVVTHIFAVELRYAQRLLDREVTPWEDFRQTSIDDVFELGDNARGLLVQFLTSAPDSELDRVLTFQTLTAGTVTASKHKIASNVFLHGIRHWGQIATVLRQKGFADQWPHDLLLSDIRM
ncbi:MAG TPA: DinB family protein [Gemmatimonadaceae bacterium]|nr:DinB family protein [Gemmatimonadaceae bacterium]